MYLFFFVFFFLQNGIIFNNIIAWINLIHIIIFNRKKVTEKCYQQHITLRPTNVITIFVNIYIYEACTISYRNQI